MKKVKNIVEFSNNEITNKPASQDKLLQYATAFLSKTENYLKNLNHTIFGDSIDN